jgi:tellurite resistance protein
MLGIKTAFKTYLTEYHQRIRSRDFLAASMGATALLALTDGELTLTKLMARDFVLHHVKQLQAFDSEEAIEFFGQTVEQLKITPHLAKEKIFKAVIKLTGDEELAPLLIRICVVIARWDNDFSEPKRKVVSELCNVLGLEDKEIYN